MKRKIAVLLTLCLMMPMITFAEHGTWTCTNCGETYDAMRNFCTRDGTPAPWVWTCATCGAENNTNEYCKNCGTMMPAPINGQYVCFPGTNSVYITLPDDWSWDYTECDSELDMHHYWSMDDWEADDYCTIELIERNENSAVTFSNYFSDMDETGTAYTSSGIQYSWGKRYRGDSLWKHYRFSVNGKTYDFENPAFKNDKSISIFDAIFDTLTVGKPISPTFTVPDVNTHYGSNNKAYFFETRDLYVTIPLGWNYGYSLNYGDGWGHHSWVYGNDDAYLWLSCERYEDVNEKSKFRNEDTQYGTTSDGLFYMHYTEKYSWSDEYEMAFRFNYNNKTYELYAFSLTKDQVSEVTAVFNSLVCQ